MKIRFFYQGRKAVQSIKRMRIIKWMGLFIGGIINGNISATLYKNIGRLGAGFRALLLLDTKTKDSSTPRLGDALRALGTGNASGSSSVLFNASLFGIPANTKGATAHGGSSLLAFAGIYVYRILREVSGTIYQSTFCAYEGIRGVLKHQSKGKSENSTGNVITWPGVIIEAIGETVHNIVARVADAPKRMIAMIATLSGGTTIGTAAGGLRAKPTDIGTSANSVLGEMWQLPYYIGSTLVIPQLGELIIPEEEEVE